MCTGFHENCECEDCLYANQLYKELAYLEQFELENKEEIDRIKYELDSMGYSY